MELTNDVSRAQVVIIYLRRLQRALLIDKRSSGTVGPWVEVLPQEELLLEGKEVSPPLTPSIVSDIERRQAFSGDPSVVASYFSQLAAYLAEKIPSIRPELGTPVSACLGLHYGPVMVLAHNPSWERTLSTVARMGYPQFVAQAREKIKALYVRELAGPETIRAPLPERLRRDFFKGEEWAMYARREEKETPGETDGA